LQNNQQSKNPEPKIGSGFLSAIFVDEMSRWHSRFFKMLFARREKSHLTYSLFTITFYLSKTPAKSVKS